MKKHRRSKPSTPSGIKTSAIPGSEESFREVKFASKPWESLLREAPYDILLSDVCGRCGFEKAGDEIRSRLAKLLAVSINPHLCGSADFAFDDLNDGSRLLTKLQRSRDPISRYVWSQISPEHKQALEKCKPRDSSSSVVLVFALNEILHGDSLYESSRFSAVTLSTKTVELLERNPAGEELVWLNRLLLEDAYPEEISRRREFTKLEQIICRRELLRTAIFACNLLAPPFGNAEIDAALAPREEGWPVVLSSFKDRAGDWREAKDRIKTLRAGEKHSARRNPRIAGEFAEFVNGWILYAALRFLGHEPYELTVPELRGLWKVVEASLVLVLGSEWQDHSDVERYFSGHCFIVGKDSVPWSKCPRWVKRDLVRDRFEGAARTIIRRLERAGKD